ncbi:MAG: hypothetical protein ACREOW_13025 [Thermodesulfobacteriota bacterium]
MSFAVFNVSIIIIVARIEYASGVSAVGRKKFAGTFVVEMKRFVTQCFIPAVQKIRFAASTIVAAVIQLVSKGLLGVLLAARKI